MDRRTLLKSTLSTTLGAGSISLGASSTSLGAGSTSLGAGLLAANAAEATAAQPASSGGTSDSGDFIDAAPGVRLAFTDWGSGKPVVFVHAWALPSPMWDYQISALCEKGLRCIAYDRRGHGRSSKPGTGYNADTLADDLAAVLNKLDLHGVTLVSHSLGSADVVRYLTRHGAGRIEKLLLIAPAALPFVTQTPDNPVGIPAEQLAFFRAKVLQADFPKWLEDGKKAFFVADTSPSLQDWVAELMRSTPLPVAIECNRLITATDFRKELPKISVPTLIIQGDKDASAPLDMTGRPTAALIPHARLNVYEGAPHGLFLTHKDRLNADLLGFIAG